MKKIYKVHLDKHRIGLGDKLSDCITLENWNRIYAGTVNGWGKNTPDLDVFKKINDYNNDHFEKNVDLVFRFPDLDLSRDKLSIYQEKAGFKITRDKNKADIAVVSIKFFEKMIVRDWNPTCTKNELLLLLNKAVIIDPNCSEILKRVNEDIEEDSIIIL